MKHLNLNDRIKIESMLNDNKNFLEIGAELKKHPDTIRNEVALHKILKQHKELGKIAKVICSNYKNCTYSHKNCFYKCSNYRETKCQKLKFDCSVCNGCDKNNTKCRLNKFYYSASEAQKDYELLLRDSRKGINMSEEELKQLNSFISPLIKKGLSPEQIKLLHPELEISIKTIYNYISFNYFYIGNMDLLRKVSYKKRKSNRNNITQAYKEGKTYDDFNKYISDNNIIDIVEMDTVEAIKDDNEPCLLTLLFRRSNLQIAILLPNQKSITVVEAIDNIYKKIGHDQFLKYFKVILTDNGKEMKLPEKIEFNESGERRCTVFYCDSYTSCQKAKCEKNHDFIRRYIYKNTSMKKYNQFHINLMMSHINSIPRKDNTNNIYTPYNKMLEISSKDFLDNLSISNINPEDLIINKKLFK